MSTEETKADTASQQDFKKADKCDGTKLHPLARAITDFSLAHDIIIQISDYKGRGDGSLSSPEFELHFPHHALQPINGMRIDKRAKPTAFCAELGAYIDLLLMANLLGLNPSPLRDNREKIAQDFQDIVNRTSAKTWLEPETKHLRTLESFVPETLLNALTWKDSYIRFKDGFLIKTFNHNAAVLTKLDTKWLLSEPNLPTENHFVHELLSNEDTSLATLDTSAINRAETYNVSSFDWRISTTSNYYFKQLGFVKEFLRESDSGKDYNLQATEDVIYLNKGSVFIGIMASVSHYLELFSSGSIGRPLVIMERGEETVTLRGGIPIEIKEFLNKKGFFTKPNTIDEVLIMAEEDAMKAVIGHTHAVLKGDGSVALYPTEEDAVAAADKPKPFLIEPSDDDPKRVFGINANRVIPTSTKPHQHQVDLASLKYTMALLNFADNNQASVSMTVDEEKISEHIVSSMELYLAMHHYWLGINLTMDEASWNAVSRSIRFMYLPKSGTTMTDPNALGEFYGRVPAKKGNRVFFKTSLPEIIIGNIFESIEIHPAPVTLVFTSYGLPVLEIVNLNAERTIKKTIEVRGDIVKSIRGYLK